MIKERVELIQEMMTQARLDYFLISDPSSIDYCLDYQNHPGERMYVLMIAKDGNHKLLMNNLFFLDDDLDVEVVWHSDTDDAIQTIVDNMDNPKRVGIDKTWPSKFLLEMMKKLPKVKYINASPCVDIIRMVKDINEQVLMIEASRINDAAMQKVIDLVAQGLTEEQVATKLEGIYQELGASGNSFTPIIAYGKNGANPHHSTDNTTLKPGDSIIIDMGCLFKGYCSDMTRTVFYKEASLKAKEVYELVKRANKEAEKFIKPGVKLCEIDNVARSIISEAGYEKEFNHRLGHFIGKDVHEYGNVSKDYDMEVEPGMIFSIEPGVYIEGEFGVRIEDLVLVTKDGCRVLNSYTKDLQII